MYLYKHIQVFFMHAMYAESEKGCCGVIGGLFSSSTAINFYYYDYYYYSQY